MSELYRGDLNYHECTCHLKIVESDETWQSVLNTNRVKFQTVNKKILKNSQENGLPVI